jgi:hypothetical protein
MRRSTLLESPQIASELRGKRWRKVNNPMLETVCAENNGDHFSSKNLFPIPQAEEPDF